MVTDLVPYSRLAVTPTNFIFLFISFFCSEFGGFITNTAILIHINHLTNGDLFYLGLSQVLFVLPLSIGSAIGGVLGDNCNKKKVMLVCESLNLVLVILLIEFNNSVLAIVMIRALIAFTAGIYGPNRQAIVQEITEHRLLRVANASFTSSFAIFNALSPYISVVLYREFHGIQAVFLLNIISYALGIMFLTKIRYQHNKNAYGVLFSASTLSHEVKAGIHYLYQRKDLFTIQLIFLITGIAIGVFYPTILPYIKQVYGGDEVLFARFMFFLSVGAISGGIVSPLMVRSIAHGKILVSFSLLQTCFFFIWTTTDNLYSSYLILLLWGASSMINIACYLHYVQLNVKDEFRSRVFSIFDMTVSASNFIGALIVMAISRLANVESIICNTASVTLAAMVFITIKLSPNNLWLHKNVNSTSS